MCVLVNFWSFFQKKKRDNFWSRKEIMEIRLVSKNKLYTYIVNIIKKNCPFLFPIVR